MRIAEMTPISAVELPSLFHGLENLPVLVLAVSGGSDSTALMLLAARWRDMLLKGTTGSNARPKLIAVTIDHGLRKEAKREAAGVADLANKLKIEHRILRWTGPKPKTGLQQAAREARYRLLAQAARASGAKHILTGHTRDDQAETVLIRLSRGSGLTGLAAMQRLAVLPYPSPEKTGLAGKASRGGVRTQGAPTRRFARGGGLLLTEEGMGQGGKDAAFLLVRPLLEIPKSRLIATLKAAKIPFAEDPSNTDPRFTRARLRQLMKTLATEGLTAERLALLARRLRRADAALEAVTDRAMAEMTLEPPKQGVIAFATADYMSFPPEIALRLLGRAIAQTGDEGPVELAKLETLAEALAIAYKSEKGLVRRTLAGACVTSTPASILVEKAPPRRARTLRKGPSQRKRR